MHIIISHIAYSTRFYCYIDYTLNIFSLCMTRFDPIDLYPFDSKIDRISHRLNIHDRSSFVGDHSSEDG